MEGSWDSLLTQGAGLLSASAGLLAEAWGHLFWQALGLDGQMPRAVCLKAGVHVMGHQGCVGVCVSQFLVGMCFRHVPGKLRRRSSKLPKVSAQGQSASGQSITRQLWRCNPASNWRGLRRESTLQFKLVSVVSDWSA